MRKRGAYMHWQFDSNAKQQQQKKNTDAVIYTTNHPKTSIFKFGTEEDSSS